MKQICTSCGLERDAEQDFRWKYKARGIRHKQCNYCQAKTSKYHYQNNKEAYIKRAYIYNKSINAKKKELLYTYLTEHPCVDCGCNDIRCLEFDHVSGLKSDNIARMITTPVAWKTIEVEIAKCEVRCANCHRIKTGERGNWWRSLPLE